MISLSLRGRTILITSGPTREPLDPIRFMTNASSGKMGSALAQEARRRGAKVILVSGPVCGPAPAGCAVVPVSTALEMLRETLRRSRQADAVIGAAAVGDWRFSRNFAHKIKRSASRLRVTLVPNPDIIKEAASRRRPGQVFVGFALETRRGLQAARRKLKAKGLDLVALNGPQSLGAARARLTLVSPDLAPRRLGLLSKTAAARKIFDEIGRRLCAKN